MFQKNRDSCKQHLVPTKSFELKGYQSTSFNINIFNRDSTLMMILYRKNFKNHFDLLWNFKCILSQQDPQVQSCVFLNKSDQFILLENNQINLYKEITQKSTKCLDVCIGIHNCSSIKCNEDDNRVFSSKFDEIYIWQKSQKCWNLIQKIELKKTMELKFKLQKNNMLILQDYGYPKLTANFYLLYRQAKNNMFYELRRMHRISSTAVQFLDDNQVLFCQKSGELKLVQFSQFRNKKIINVKTILLKIARWDEIITQLYFFKKQKLILAQAFRTLYIIQQDQNKQYKHQETKFDFFEKSIAISQDCGTLFFIKNSFFDQYKVI